MATKPFLPAVPPDWCIRCFAPPLLRGRQDSSAPAEIKLLCCQRTVCVTCADEPCPRCFGGALGGPRDGEGPSVMSLRKLMATTSKDSPRAELPSYTTNQEQPPPYESYEPVESKDEKGESSNSNGQVSTSEALPVYDSQGNYVGVTHYISKTDTLVGISLRYNVPVNDIKKANKLILGDLSERSFIVIPGARCPESGPQPPSAERLAEIERASATTRFQLATRCIDRKEIDLYLDLHGPEKAAESYLQDLEWEKTHPISKPPRAKRKTSKWCCA